jgi:pyrroline-5-carboxylate reductase
VFFDLGLMGARVMTTIQFGMVGGGVMGEALLSRLIAHKVYDPAAILISEPMAARRQVLSDKYGVQTTADNHQVATATIAILLAIKPQIFATVAAEVTAELHDHRSYQFWLAQRCPNWQPHFPTIQ